MILSNLYRKFREKKNQLLYRSSNLNDHPHACASQFILLRVAYLVCADINRRRNLRPWKHELCSWKRFFSSKQRLLGAWNTKSAPKPLQNTLHGKRALDRCFIKEDEDSEEAASLFDKAGHDRQKFQGWSLCHDCVDFSEAIDGGIARNTPSN